jgi:hypothetical protein
MVTGLTLNILNIKIKDKKINQYISWVLVKRIV